MVENRKKEKIHTMYTELIYD